MFFSIVIVSFNAEKFIEETVKSVLEQKFDDYEIIVKDACSTDNTVNKIPKSEKIKLVVTPDKGIYDGMNEAIGYTSGQYILFLNCGDILIDKNVLSTVYKKVKDFEYPAVVYGDYKRKGITCKQPSIVTDFFLYRTPLCHQSMFFSKEIFYKIGLYNTDYQICADYELTIHAFLKNISFIYCDCIICDYLFGGVSESEKGKMLKEEEYTKIKDTYFSKSKQKFYDFKLFLSLKGLRQKLASDKSPLFIRKLYRRLVNFVNR